MESQCHVRMSQIHVGKCSGTRMGSQTCSRDATKHCALDIEDILLKTTNFRTAFYPSNSTYINNKRLSQMISTEFVDDRHFFSSSVFKLMLCILKQMQSWHQENMP